MRLETQRLKSVALNPLYQNSFFMVASRVLTVFTGFLFWIVAARFFPQEDVGVAVTLISSASLITFLSIFGFDISLIRFFNSYDRSKIFNTCLTVSVLASVVFSLAYIAGIGFFSKELYFIQNPVYAAVFIGYTILNSIALVTSQTFIALRNAKYSFLQNLLAMLRVPLLIPLVVLGSYGILCSTSLAQIFAFIIVFFILSRYIKFYLTVDREFITKAMGVSTGNYIVNLVDNAEPMVLSILILNLLGSESVAQYYIANTIGGFLLQIPYALSISLLVEGVHGQNLRSNVIKAVKAVYAILIPGVIFFILFGQYLLMFFGESYANAFGLLRLVAIVSLLYAIYAYYIMISNIKMNIKTIIGLNTFKFLAFIALSYIMMQIYGIIGVGYAMVIVYLLIDIIILAPLRLWKLDLFSLIK